MGAYIDESGNWECDGRCLECDYRDNCEDINCDRDIDFECEEEEGLG